jgi:oligopeptide transport system ATP-binding protein
MHLLKVEDLSVCFHTHDGVVQAVNNVSFELAQGQNLGIVGESGSGKSQTVLAAMGLLAANGRAQGKALYRGANLLTMSTPMLNTIRGNRVSMIFQDPMTSLNPYLTVERQMTEVLQLHKAMSRRQARKRAIGLLESLCIPQAAQRIDRYPHEFSGGMRQRVMIAIALLCEPEVLIADEPTTALDVTVQAQILTLLRALQHDFGTAIIMITHDMGVVAGLCEDVMVMYAGRVMESGRAEHIFQQPSHPYTIGLLGALPRIDRSDTALISIPGDPPDMAHMPSGCAFAPRCTQHMPLCAKSTPPLRVAEHTAQVQRVCHKSVAEVHAACKDPNHA